MQRIWLHIFIPSLHTRAASLATLFSSSQHRGAPSLTMEGRLSAMKRDRTKYLYKGNFSQSFNAALPVEQRGGGDAEVISLRSSTSWPRQAGVECIGNISARDNKKEYIQYVACTTLTIIHWWSFGKSIVAAYSTADCCTYLPCKRLHQAQNYITLTSSTLPYKIHFARIKSGIQLSFYQVKKYPDEMAAQALIDVPFSLT